MNARDAIYRVLTDSLPLGPKRCPRQGVTKGLCCLCYYLRGESCVETSLHLAFDCPYTQRILAAVFRAFTSATGTSAQQAALHNMSAPHICATYARPLVSGLLLLDDQIEKADLQEPFQNLIGITTQAIINRQHRNNDVSRPLESDPAMLLKAICDRLKTVASGLYQVANSEEKRIEIKFDGWLPEVTPIEKFKSKWVKPGLVDWAKGKLRCLTLNGARRPTKHGTGPPLQPRQPTYQRAPPFAP